MKRETVVCLFVCAVILWGAQSCNVTPTACFSTSTGGDTVQVNKAVTFNAGCSYKADSYNWQFYGNPDSIDFGQIVTKTFKDTGSVAVYLLVTNGNNVNSTMQTVDVIQ